MGNRNSRGQSTLEVMIVLLVLTSLIMIAIEYSTTSAKLFRGAELSKEMR